MFPTSLTRRAFLFALLVGVLVLGATATQAQVVPGGTQVTNRASATYTEPEGGSVSAVSNQVTLTIADVNGLAITPDDGAAPGVYGGASGVTVTFAISNTGNVPQTIQFGASAISITGPYTTDNRWVDLDGNGNFDAGDVDLTQANPSFVLAAGESRNVLLTGQVSASAPAGTIIRVQLGDAATGSPNFDSQPVDVSAGDVRTSGSTGVNGDLEARGDLSFTVTATGAVLLGPMGQPAAVGPTDNNDDYTNRTMTVGVAVPAGGVTTATQQIVFINTVRNSAGVDDTISLSLQSVPGAAFTNAYEISTDGGATYQAFRVGDPPVTLNVPAGSDANIRVRVNSPVGINVLSAYQAVIRATSGITPQNFNETIDRLYSGFLDFNKTATVTNATGIGGPTDAVPGAEIEYVVTYTNVSPAATGSGNAELTATNIVITEDGNEAPNTWGATTDHIAGSASDSRGGAITGDIVGSSLLTDTIPSLAPTESGTFRFSRRIR